MSASRWFSKAASATIAHPTARPGSVPMTGGGVLLWQPPGRSGLAARQAAKPVKPVRGKRRAIPALSRNCDGPDGPKPGRLLPRWTLSTLVGRVIRPGTRGGTTTAPLRRSRLPSRLFGRK